MNENKIDPIIVDTISKASALFAKPFKEGSASHVGYSCTLYHTLVSHTLMKGIAIYRELPAVVCCYFLTSFF